MVKNEEDEMTDENLELLADKIESRMVNRFYHNLGHGVWKLAWRGIVLAAVGLAAYGAVKR